jgi:hypothetical protein
MTPGRGSDTGDYFSLAFHARTIFSWLPVDSRTKCADAERHPVVRAHTRTWLQQSLLSTPENRLESSRLTFMLSR